MAATSKFNVSQLVGLNIHAEVGDCLDANKFTTLASSLLQMIDESAENEEKWYRVACDLVSTLNSKDQRYIRPYTAKPVAITHPTL